ncbi:MAG: hypothetical protein EHM42_06935 [Planctomycetaceae bacterium]|nr:MAG: hypothetical protein EHM42_06935 [Planctomycetaceae bacterium]
MIHRMIHSGTVSARKALRLTLDRRIWLVPFLGAAMCGLVYWQSAARYPTGAASGTAIPSSTPNAPAATEVWRVAIWNIHSGKGRDQRVDLPRIATHLTAVDFVALNEVRGLAGRPVLDQAAALGELLDAGGLFLPYERRFGRDDFGNGVVTRSSVSAWVRIPLPHTRVKGHGNVTLLSVTHLERPVQVLVTHIDHGADRRRQLEFVYELFQSLSEPAVLMGDLNTQGNDAPLVDWLSEPGVIDPLAACAVVSPADRVDWILVRGLECLSAGCEETGASDHPLIWAELALPERSRE